MEVKGMFRTFVLLSTLVFALSLTVFGLPQEAVLEFNPTDVQIHFTLGDVIHTVHGTFRLKSGTIKFNSETGLASGLVVVDATSGETGSTGRDKKMHKDVLESSKYPEITFTPVHLLQGHLSPQEDSEVELQGIFGLHGGNHEITLSAHIHMTGERLTIDSHFSVPYVQWGLQNPSNFILRVNDSLNVDLHAVGRISN
jgi:polyisoprenoid-binding protein YceI